MDIDGIIAQLQQMLGEMENRPEDAHELYEQVHQELNRLKATGQPLPDDLIALERRLEEEFEKAAPRPISKD